MDGSKMAARRPIDAETLVQQALAGTGALPWPRIGDRELAFDRGLDAKPRRRPPSSWLLAEACAGVRYQGRPIVAARQPSGDAERVIAAVRRLPPRQAALVIEHARSKTRPDWLPDAELMPLSPVWTDPLRRTVKVIRHDGSGRHARYVAPFCPVIFDPTWRAICSARDDYALWHAGVTSVMAAIGDELTHWQINGIAAPAAPWLAQPKETA